VTSERDLVQLLATMDPQLHQGVFVFCVCEAGDVPAGLNPLMLFREVEATTVVIPLAEVDGTDLDGQFPCEWITLGAHSDLRAVGFLAAVTTSLAAAGISTNAVSASFHDHLFVPAGQGEPAVAQLLALQSAHQRLRD
jgi:hypothetical protein